VLTSGQRLRLGSLELEFHDDAAPITLPGLPPQPPPIRPVGLRPTTAPVVAMTATGPPPLSADESTAITSRGPNDCNAHAGVLATFICQRCGTLSCPACVKTQRAGTRTVNSCPSCGGICVDLEMHRKAQLKKQATFLSLLPDAFRYPLRKNGPILLVCGTIFFTVVEGARELLAHVRIGGFMMMAYWITLVIGTGYLFAFMQNIIVSSTNGEDQMPGFPEVSNFSDDIFMPFLRFFMIQALCFGPGIGLIVASAFLGGAALLMGIAVLLLGVFCFPMALLTVSLADSIGGLNPLVIFSGISKLPGPYLITCLILLGVMGVGGIIRFGLSLTGIPVLPMILSMPISLYGLTVGMRVLGLLYYTNKEKLAWFS
jgi:hypothetical protein